MGTRDAVELTYALGAAARLTGLSPELLRAWERRYRVVEPLRSAGGTRRYRAADLERLRLVKAAVDAGHRIGQVARMEREELERLCGEPRPAAGEGLRTILRAIEQLDGVEAQCLLSLRLSALGPVRFAHEVAGPLVEEIGERWASRRLGVASEHLATALLRSLLGAALQPTSVSARGPRVLFATPSGERHELGLQMAALTALGAGANPIYLGADLPIEELVRAAESSRPAAAALSVVTLSRIEAERAVDALRAGLRADVRLWLGGAGSTGLAPRVGVEVFGDLGALERRVHLLGYERAG
jgi:MerR family transcriptional regulator, light-induced transcriptional regulator